MAESNFSSEKDQWFTTTHWSVILAAADAQSPKATEALETLCRTYWYPVYAYVRRRGNDAHSAQDLVQEFFARLLEKNYFQGVQREKGRFRSFLLASINHFLANEYDRQMAAKRGGGRKILSLDETTAEGLYLHEPVSDLSPEKIFEQRWAITLLERAFKRLEDEAIALGKSELFQSLRGFVGDETGGGDYKELASKLGMSANAVAAAVYRLRKRYKELVRDEVGQTVTSCSDLDDEMRHLFAALS